MLTKPTLCAAGLAGLGTLCALPSESQAGECTTTFTRNSYYPSYRTTYGFGCNYRRPNYYYQAPRTITIYRRHNPYCHKSYNYTSSTQRTPRISGNNLVRQIQIKLNNLGYAVGRIDGTLNPRTRIALRRYQYEYGLKATGQVDEALLRSMCLIE